MGRPLFQPRDAGTENMWLLSADWFVGGHLVWQTNEDDKDPQYHQINGDCQRGTTEPFHAVSSHIWRLLEQQWISSENKCKYYSDTVECTTVWALSSYANLWQVTRYHDYNLKRTWQELATMATQKLTKLYLVNKWPWPAKSLTAARFNFSHFHQCTLLCRTNLNVSWIYHLSARFLVYVTYM